MIFRQASGDGRMHGQANHHDTAPRRERNNTVIIIGIDIGKEKHAAAFLDGGDGRTLCPPRFFENTHDGAKALWALAEKLSGDGDVHVGMEATGNCWKPFHDFLSAQGAHVDVINPIVSAASIAGDIRGRKTDKRDAETIANLVREGRASLRRPESGAELHLKALTRQRRFLVGQRSALKNRLQDQLLEAFPEFPRLFADLFAPLPLALLEKYPTAAALARAHRPAVAKLVQTHTRGKDPKAEANRLVAAAHDSICTAYPPASSLGAAIRSTLRALRDADANIDVVEKEIGACEPPETARILMGIKGAGNVLPMIVASEFGGLDRFETSPRDGKTGGMARRLLAFAGCEPRIRESGKWRGRLRVSKRGSGQLRLALYLMANTIRLNDPGFGAYYEEKRKTKHHCVALFHVVRKILDVLCSLHKSGETYSPNWTGKLSTPPENTCENNPQMGLLKP